MNKLHKCIGSLLAGLLLVTFAACGATEDSPETTEPTTQAAAETTTRPAEEQLSTLPPTTWPTATQNVEEIIAGGVFTLYLYTPQGFAAMVRDGDRMVAEMQIDWADVPEGVEDVAAIRETFGDYIRTIILPPASAIMVFPERDIYVDLSVLEPDFEEAEIEDLLHQPGVGIISINPTADERYFSLDGFTSAPVETIIPLLSMLQI